MNKLYVWLLLTFAGESNLRAGRTFANASRKPSSSGKLALRPSRRLTGGRYSLVVTLRDGAGWSRTVRSTLSI